jgi:predicted metal-dependent phosphoesterase TrpH
VSVRIDLHAHSNVSDGTTSPGDVVRRAAERGLDVLALTDHDTSAGWAEAAEGARTVGLCFVPGLEVSTKLAGRSVHLLAYLPDVDYPPLAAELPQIVAGRGDRLTAMLAQLAAVDREVSAEDVRRQTGAHGVVGRPHVADALVAKGFARDRAAAFERWLNPGRAGFVVRYAPRTPDMVRIVNDAGGVAVIAHPWGRSSRSARSVETLAELADGGLVGIEVDHQDHSPTDRDTLRRLASELGLVATGSSDYHGVGKVDHELGCNVTAPDEFRRLVAAASVNATASGRRVPEIVGLENAGPLR